MKSKLKIWMKRVAPALVLGLGMLGLMASNADAQSHNQRLEKQQFQLHQRQERNIYGKGAVKGHQKQEKQQFKYEERLERSYGNRYGQYSPYGVVNPLPPVYNQGQYRNSPWFGTPRNQHRRSIIGH